MVKIFDVTEGSKAYEAGIRAGDQLIAVNGHEISDVLDYSFYMAKKHVILKLYRSGVMFDARIVKSTYEDIGLNFESFLMDKQHACKNKCVFCFIDQNPKGMRSPIYFKDDDSRMSFISGSYITLTNLSERDIDRIVLMKTSPINISVHTTNPELRVRMMNNKYAGNVLDIMRRFAEAHITMNCQIVLCRDLNDGEELNRSMHELAELYPAVNSVSIVPAGLTKYREENGLYPLEPFTPEQCRQIIKQVTDFGDICLEKLGSRLFFCGDELYIKGGLEIPDGDFYEGYPQLANGVGTISSMYDEFESFLDSIDINDYQPNRKREVSIATGEAAYGFISAMARVLEEICPGLTCHVYAIKNEFFGENITVTGLLTGQDLAKQLEGKRLGERLLLSCSMLRFERDMFLDNMTPDELSRTLHVPIEFTENDGGSFVESVLK